MSADELERREKAAFHAIKDALVTDAGEEIRLFVDHHLAELSASYWQQHLGTGTPTPAEVLNLLELSLNTADREVECLDFTLPGEVTNYVIAVYFDGSGSVEGIAMES